MPLQAQSLGNEVDIWHPQRGVVHSAFDHAVNLLMDGELWTVLAAARPDAPFGIRLAPDAPLATRDVQAADRVHVRAGHIGVGNLILDCRTASRWAPIRWTSPAVGLAERLFAAERVARPRAWRESAGMAAELTNALRDSGANSDVELAAAVRRTVGRGPGLTPAGDDVLVGILTVLTSGATGAAGDLARSRLVSALPASPSTSDVSHHLLAQAARGLPGRALHDLGKVLVEDAPLDALADALGVVLNTGFTSGADACLGLIAACRLWFLTAEKETA